MDLNHCEASLLFPTVPRFCGQTFLEAHDKELALACVQVYNDWMASGLLERFKTLKIVIRASPTPSRRPRS